MTTTGRLGVDYRVRGKTSGEKARQTRRAKRRGGSRTAVPKGLTVSMDNEEKRMDQLRDRKGRGKSLRGELKRKKDGGTERGRGGKQGGGKRPKISGTGPPCGRQGPKAFKIFLGVEKKKKRKEWEPKASGG